MLNSRRTLSSLLAVAALGAAASAGQFMSAQVDRVMTASRAVSGKVTGGLLAAATSPEQRAAFLNGRTRSAWHRNRWPGGGWTVAHDRRMARKRRNVIKARRAGRG